MTEHYSDRRTESLDRHYLRIGQLVDKSNQNKRGVPLDEINILLNAAEIFFITLIKHSNSQYTYVDNSTIVIEDNG